jgi:hypothetical protein
MVHPVLYERLVSVRIVLGDCGNHGVRVSDGRGKHFPGSIRGPAHDQAVHSATYQVG